jgi:hypothetical protein
MKFDKHSNDTFCSFVIDCSYTECVTIDINFNEVSIQRSKRKLSGQVFEAYLFPFELKFIARAERKVEQRDRPDY